MRVHAIRMLLVGLALLAGAADAAAHPDAVAFWKITLGDSEAHSEIVVPLADVGPNPADRLATIGAEVITQFAIYEGDTRVTAQVTDTRLLSSGSLHIQAVHVLTGQPRLRVLRSTFHERTDDSHRVIARLERQGIVTPLVFDAATPEHALREVAPSTWFATVAPAGSARAMVLLGVSHILTGYDHLVFLGCLLLPARSWRARVAIVSAFTAAHSVTLGLAAAQLVVLPPQFIEAAIAISVAYVALENLLSDEPRTGWLAAFGFGLIHGFGFAAMLNLAELPVGEWLASVVAFNLGVELGQLVVVAVAVPVLVVIARRPWHRRLVQCTSLSVLGLAVFWFVERLH